MKKKTILAALAAAMVCAISVTGTLAYLTAQSKGDNGVVNTFIAGDTELIDQKEDPDPPAPDPENPDDPPTPIDADDYSFVVEEHQVGWVKDAATNVETLEYVTSSGAEAETDAQKVTVLWNNYKLLPGVNAPKDPFVHIDAGKKTDNGAYLFIKVTGLRADGNVSAAIDSTNWKPVSGIDGLYVYQTGNTAPEVITKASMNGTDLNLNVLDQKATAGGKAVTVANLTSEELKADEDALDYEITVKAYMVQAVELTDSFTLAHLYNEAFGSGSAAPDQP